MEIDSFKIVDGDTGNSVGSYPDRGRAMAAFRQLLLQRPADPGCLVLVAMDTSGHPVESWLADDIAAAQT